MFLRLPGKYFSFFQLIYKDYNEILRVTAKSQKLKFRFEALRNQNSDLEVNVIVIVIMYTYYDFFPFRHYVL